MGSVCNSTKVTNFIFLKTSTKSFYSGISLHMTAFIPNEQYVLKLSIAHGYRLRSPKDREGPHSWSREGLGRRLGTRALLLASRKVTISPDGLCPLPRALFCALCPVVSPPDIPEHLLTPINCAHSQPHRHLHRTTGSFLILVNPSHRLIVQR